MNEKTKQVVIGVVALIAVVVAVVIGSKTVGPTGSGVEVVGELSPGSTTSLRDAEKGATPGVPQPATQEADASGMPAELK